MPCADGKLAVPNGIDGTTEPGACDKGGGGGGCCKCLPGIPGIGGRCSPAVNFKMCSVSAGSVPGGGGGIIPPINGSGNPGNELFPF